MVLDDVTAVIVIYSLVAIAAITLFLIIFLHFYKKKYVKFVVNHSLANKAIDGLNAIYSFKSIPSFDMFHSYDNEAYYDMISPRDYLIYQLVFEQKEILKAIKNTEINAEMYERYIDEIKLRCQLDRYDVTDLPRNKWYLRKIEKRILRIKTKHPTTLFELIVELTLTKINGVRRRRKHRVFGPIDIKGLIKQVNQKDGRYYLNQDIWNSICRVERGKVSNKMRFAIFKRDGNRCVKCGSRYNLEIDHIIPIAKGGKSTYTNLQTLCHKCNVRKGSNIE